MATSINDQMKKLKDFGDYRIISIEIKYKLKKQKSNQNLIARAEISHESADMLKNFDSKKIFNKNELKDDKAKVDAQTGQIICHSGDVLADSYKVLNLLGMGTFAKVYQVEDLKNAGKVIALKVTRNIKKFTHAAELEINMLKTIKNNDPFHKYFCIQLLDSFVINEHKCLTFDLMGPSLYKTLTQNNFTPFCTQNISHIIYQVCIAVKFLHDNKIIHTDIKPENILFTNSENNITNKIIGEDKIVLKNTNIKLIDFGSAIFEWENHPPVITTRNYRAVEVILKLDWNKKCDIWSIGCTLLELYMGYALFQAVDEREHLAMIEKTLGPLPAKFTKKSEYYKRGVLDWDENSEAGEFIRKNCRKLKNYVFEEKADMNVMNLALKMLKYDVDERITASSALEHEFFLLVPNKKRHEDDPRKIKNKN